MAIKYKEMVKGVTLTGTPQSFYTAGALTSAVIQAATINNPTGGALTVDIYKVPTGLAADGTTKICTRSVPAGAVVMGNETLNHKLEPGTQIYAAGNGLTLNISGVEYVPE